MKAYKGFDKDLKCRGFQYEVGKEYEQDGKVKCCENGFHACEVPLDVFNYYPPATSRYCEVEQIGKTRKNNDKVASSKIKIGAEIGIPGLVKAHVEWVKANAKTESAATNTGDRSAATNTGNWSAATNTGDQSAATNTGNWSAATNTGNWSAATNTGDRSAATNTGKGSVATNTGKGSVATNTGDSSAATNTGDRSAATNTGNWSAATVGKGGSVAVVTGIGSKARADIGSAIVVCERGELNGETYPLLGIRAAIVDGEVIKANTFYKLVNGEFVECE